LKRGKRLCARGCNGGGKRGVGGEVGRGIEEGAGRTGWTMQEAKEEKAKRGKKVGSLKN